MLIASKSAIYTKTSQKVGLKLGQSTSIISEVNSSSIFLKEDNWDIDSLNLNDQPQAK